MLSQGKRSLYEHYGLNNNTYVAPNSYQHITDYYPIPHPAPFLTSASKEPLYLNPNYCKSLIYGIKDDTKDTRLGTSPKSKTKRIFHDLSPGPAVTKNVPKEVKCPSAFADKDKKKPLRKFYVCRVEYNSLGWGPSVPSDRHKYGYYLDEIGRIVLVPPEDEDRSAGPAKYGSNMKKSIYDQNYKGIKIPTSPREQKKDSFPGPADYNKGDLDFHRDPEGDIIRGMARRRTNLPRYIDKLQIDLRRNNSPGPADYDRAKPICKRCPPLKLSPTIIKPRGFIPEPGPGPTDYTTEPTFLPFKNLKVPFLIGSKRFPVGKPTCGPADYYTSNDLETKLRKDKCYSQYQPPFGQGAKRLLTTVTHNPGPADFSVVGTEKRKKKPTSIFCSKTKRWPTSGKKLDFLELAKAYDYLFKEKPSNEGNLPFNSTSPVLPYFDISCTPANTKFNTCKPLISKGYFLPHAPRFPESKDKFPGPGQYLIHPLYTSSTYNALHTFNLKLKEKATKMAYIVHPRSTAALWAKERRKKKKLRWFCKEGKEYVHCLKDMKPYKF